MDAMSGHLTEVNPARRRQSRLSSQDPDPKKAYYLVIFRNHGSSGTI